MKHMPDKIYLNCEGADNDTDFNKIRKNVTWSEIPMSDEDIEFINADLRSKADVFSAEMFNVLLINARRYLKQEQKQRFIEQLQDIER